MTARGAQDGTAKSVLSSERFARNDEAIAPSVGWGKLRNRGIALGAVLLVIVAAFVGRMIVSSPVAISRTNVAAVRVARQVQWRTTASAELTRGQVEIVALSAPGRVERIFRRVGDSVAVGDTIATFANPDLAAELSDAEQRLLQARADHEAQLSAGRIEQLKLDDDVATARTQDRRAEQQLKLVELLLPQKLASPSEYEQGLYEVTMAKDHLNRTIQRSELTVSAAAALERSRADQQLGLARAVQTKRDRVSQLTIRASRSGVVSDLFVEPGQWIALGSPVLRIRTGDDLYGEVKLTDLDAADVRAENTVIVRFRMDSAVGVVTGVDPVAKGGVVAIRFRVPRAVGSAPASESLADVEIVTGSTATALLVEAPTVARSKATGRVLVLTSDQTQAAWRTVQWGRRAGSMLEVRGGLIAGESILRTSDALGSNALSVRVRIRP